MEDMNNLATHEAGTGWGQIGIILSGNNTDLMLAQLLKAVVDENKIIIRQNELLLRAFKNPSPARDQHNACPGTTLDRKSVV